MDRALGGSTVPGRRVRFELAGRALYTRTGRFWWELSLLLLALALLNGSNYVLHVVLSRLLGPEDYGALAALLAVLMVLSVPVMVVQTVVAKQAAGLKGAGRLDETAALAVSAAKGVLPFAAGGALLIVALSPALAGFLDVGEGTALLLAPYSLLALLTGIALGVFQGRLEFGRFAAVTLAGVFVRVATALALVWAGLGVAGAIVATLLAQAVSLGVGFALLRVAGGWWRRASWTLRPFRGEIVGSLLGLGGFWLLAEIDIVLARHYLPGREAGLYSAAGLLARALLFLSAAVSLAAFPRFAEERRRAESYRWLRLSLVAVVALVLVGLAGLVLLREQLVTGAFGGRFAEAAGFLPLLGICAGLLAVVNLLVYFHIAAGTRAHLFLFGGVAAQAVLIDRFHESPMEVAAVATAVNAAVAVLQLHAAVALGRSKRPAIERRADAPGWAASRSAGEPTLELSVVLPCHNAGAELRRTLRTIVAELGSLESYEVIVVSDGSTDETARVTNEFADAHVRLLDCPQQVGKGHALRVGLRTTRGRYVAFLDADGDIDPRSLRSFLQLMQLLEPDVVIGSKRHPLSDVSYPPLRRVLSWGYHKLTRLLFRVDVRDTQTGCKLIRRDVLEAVLPRAVENRFAFDLEFLVIARRLGFRRLLEAPITLEHRFSSHVNGKAVVRIFFDTLAIFYRRYLLNTYRPEPTIALGAEASAPQARPRTVQAAEAGKLRILILNWRDIRNPEAGGAEVFTHEVASRWVARGHEVTLFTSRFRGSAPVEFVDEVRIRRSGRLRTGAFYAQVQRQLWGLRGFDVVIDEINSVPHLTPLWQRRLPPSLALIHQLAAEVWDFELPRPLAAIGRWLEPRLLRLYRDAPVVTISDSTRADLQSLGLRNVAVVHGGCEAPAVDVDKEAVPTFLFVGRLAANKRPQHALAAFVSIKRAIPAARLWVIGRGPLERELERDLPEGAELLGHVPRAELFERMARAHCLLVPSVREGWGLVVIEANAVGTPAVGYDVAGIRDSIRDGKTGLLARAGDPEALAQQAVSLVSDASMYTVVQRQALEWAERFSWDATADRLLELVEQAACASHAQPRPAGALPVRLAIAPPRPEA